MPVDRGIPERKLDLGVAQEFVRPLGDVPARRPITVSLVSAFHASEVAVAHPVFLVHVSTPWTGLTSVSCFDFPNHYALSLSNMSQGVSEEPVWDAVNLPCALLCPFAFTLPEFSEVFDGYVSVELLSEADNFVGYLPQSCSDVVSLFSAEAFKFEAGLPLGAVVSMLLESGSAFLESELFGGNVLPIVGLLQNLAFVDYGYGDLGAVYVDAHPARSNGGFWQVFGEGDEEFEVPFHNYAGYHPSFFEVFLETLISSALAYGKPYPFLIGSDGENWVSTAGLSEAEEPPVKPHDTPAGLTFHGFPVAPSVPPSLNHKLRRDTMLVPELSIGFMVELCACPGSPSLGQQLLDHAEEGLVSFPEKPSFSLGQLEKIQGQALTHPAVPTKKTVTSLKSTPIPPHPHGWGLLGGI